MTDVLRDQDLPLALREEFREAIRTLAPSRRAEAWETLFKCVRWALASGPPTTTGDPQ